MYSTDKWGVSKDIVSGVIISSLVFGIAVHVPLIGFFCAFMMPLPILFYRSKLGRNAGILVPVLTLLSIFIILGRASIDLFFFAEFLIAGFILGELIELNLSIEKTVLYACGSVLCIGVTGLLFYSSIQNMGVTAIISQYITRSLELTVALYRDMGVSKESLDLITDSMGHIQYVIIRIIPGFLVITTLFVVWSNLLIAKPLFSAKNLYYPAFGSLKLWKAPDFLVWVAIGSAAIFILSDKTLKMIGLNGILILMMVYLLQGIAIISFFFEKKKFPRPLRIFLYSLIALQKIALLIVIGVGFFDMWLNFRRLTPTENK